MNSVNARKLAYEILYGVFYESKFSNKELALKVDRQPIPDTDRRLTRTLVYGVIENTLWLEWVIDQLSSVRLKKIDKRVLVLLKTGVYQLAFLERIPASAAVNETVNLVKKINPKSVGFVNAIMRQFIRQKSELVLPDEVLQPNLHLSIKYSHPEWLVALWIEQFGRDKTLEILKANNTVPKVCLRVNLCETTVDEAVRSLESEGYSLQTSEVLPYGLMIDQFGETGLQTTEAFRKGWIIVQDLSSMLVGEVMSPKAGECVLDVCSAPGGKTTHLAEKMNRQGIVVARDVSEEKLNRIRENAERLKHNNIQIVIGDGSVFDSADHEKYDKILVDAPCSGLGIIRRKPEIRLNKTAQEMAALLPIQRDILNQAAKALKPGGMLVYSTCTIDPRENQEQVKQFLETHPEFEANDLRKEFSTLANEKGFIQLYQSVGGLDGFFIAQLLKKK